MHYFKQGGHMDTNWIGQDFSSFKNILTTGIIIYFAIIALTKIIGLRSFSKMSASDFAVTLAIGSTFAASINSASPNLINSLLSLVFLFCAQWIIARVRCHFPQSLKWLDNTPLLLMEDGKFNEINMKKANVSENDILAKLREANAYDLNKVHAVIFETTGGISVLHGDNFTKNKNFILKDVQHSKL